MRIVEGKERRDNEQKVYYLLLGGIQTEAALCVDEVERDIDTESFVNFLDH